MLSINISSFFFKVPSRTNNFNPRLILLFFSPMASSTKVTVEYAKSGRSSCKKCDEKIPAKSVRLGLVSKHPQGFDQTKWHHPDCFPFSSDFVSSVEDIAGFSLLQVYISKTLTKFKLNFAICMWSIYWIIWSDESKIHVSIFFFEFDMWTELSRVWVF